MTDNDTCGSTLRNGANSVTLVLKTGLWSHGPKERSMYAYTPPIVIFPQKSDAPPLSPAQSNSVKRPWPPASIATSSSRQAVRIETPVFKMLPAS